jgi:hypothetical protein
VKKLLWLVYATAVLVSTYGLVFGQEIQYSYTIINQPVSAQDLNVHGDVVLTNYPHPGGTILSKKTKMAPVQFRCWDTIYDATQITKIDNQGNVVGNCQIDGTRHGRQVGFVRDKKGNFTFIDVPGADITNPRHESKPPCSHSGSHYFPPAVVKF